ncbi:hypothetical protein CLF_100070, partial [Clonorchis sinensis]
MLTNRQQSHEKTRVRLCEVDFNQRMCSPEAALVKSRTMNDRLPQKGWVRKQNTDTKSVRVQMVNTVKERTALNRQLRAIFSGECCGVNRQCRTLVIRALPEPYIKGIIRGTKRTKPKVFSTGTRRSYPSKLVMAVLLWAVDFSSVAREELRVLVRKQHNPEGVKTAKRTGTLLSFLDLSICYEIIISDPWFLNCQIERYNYDHLTSTISPVLLKTNTTDIADKAMEHITDTESKLFVLNQKLRKHHPGIRSSVDILRDEISDVIMFYEVDDDFGLQLASETFESSKEFFKRQIHNELPPNLLNKKHYIKITPQRLLEHPKRKIIEVHLEYITVIKPTEMSFPERWKVGTQGVIDALDTAHGARTNFQLHVYADRHKKLIGCNSGVTGVSSDGKIENVGKTVDDQRDIYHNPHANAHRPQQQLELDALVREKDFAEFVNDCELLDELLNFLGPSSYDCFPQLRHMDVDDKTYLRVNVLFPEAALQAPGINVKSDLEFAALLKNKWSGNHCTLYSFGRGPVYDVEECSGFVLLIGLFKVIVGVLYSINVCRFETIIEYGNRFVEYLGSEVFFETRKDTRRPISTDTICLPLFLYPTRVLTMKGYKPSLEKYGEEDLETLNDKAALEFSRRVFRDTAVMWQCEMKVATVKLSNVRSSRLPKKGLRDSPSAWKKTSQNMAQVIQIIVIFLGMIYRATGASKIATVDSSAMKLERKGHQFYDQSMGDLASFESYCDHDIFK